MEPTASQAGQTEPQVDEVAARYVAQAQAAGRLDQYALVVRALPRLLHQHGLGQTLAYLQGRGAGRPDSPYQQVRDQLGAWLATTLGLSGDALTELTRGDSGLYLRAADAARLFVLALSRAIADATAGARGAPPDPAAPAGSGEPASPGASIDPGASGDQRGPDDRGGD